MAKNTIVLKNYSKIREEYNAVAAITPGHLVEMTSAGKVQVHANAGQNAIPMFALEDELQGKGIDDAYSVDDPVQVWIPGRGDQVYAVLKDGEDVLQGDFLESANDGTLQKHEAGSANVVEYPEAIVAQALENLDLSGSSGEESTNRIKVRIA